MECKLKGRGENGEAYKTGKACWEQNYQALSYKLKSLGEPLREFQAKDMMDKVDGMGSGFERNTSPHRENKGGIVTLLRQI